MKIITIKANLILDCEQTSNLVCVEDHPRHFIVDGHKLHKGDCDDQEINGIRCIICERTGKGAIFAV